MIMNYPSFATELCDDFFLILKKGYTPETPILSTISRNNHRKIGFVATS